MSALLANRPGLGALSYRAGTFASFFAAMKTRLSSAGYPGLAALRTRDADDWTIALIDAWAAVADVLTFYQERIANEGYVRTATERLSILELGRTVGYQLRPGVAATAYLAYTMDPNADVSIPAGTRAQSVPAQGQLPQAFESSSAVHATGAWNTLGVRTERPQRIDLSERVPRQLYFSGTSLNLKPDDVLLLVDPNHASAEYPNQPIKALARIRTVDVQVPTSRTHVTLEAILDPSPEANVTAAVGPAGQEGLSPIAPATPDSLLSGYQKVADGLLAPPAQHPSSPTHLPQKVSETFGANHEALAKTLTVLHPALASTLFPALQQSTAAATKPVEVFAFRVSASPFGANAPLKLLGFMNETVKHELPKPTGAHDPGGIVPYLERTFTAALAEFRAQNATLKNVPQYVEWPLAPDESPGVVSLDRAYPSLVSGTWVVLMGPGEASPAIAKIASVENVGRADYGISGNTAQLTLSREWYKRENTLQDVTIDTRTFKESTIGFLRKTEVFAQSEELTLVDLPIPSVVEGASLELDAVYDGLDAGRWLIVSGTRTDVPGAPAAELVMLATSEHTVDPTLADDTLHTRLRLSNPLAYKYDRKSITVYGNVVRTTHGQTWNEVLGSGTGAVALQTFTLKQSPLTFVPASSAAGAQTTLQVSVNGVPWTETPSFDAMGPTDRGYVTVADNAMKTSTIFGDGVHGARLPTGTENVTAAYRAGIGDAGNVDAGQITLLASRPLGVKSVINPLPATGGADPENVNQGRSNVPLATAALDRIVSADDYASVARTFAGVAKAVSTQFPGTPPAVYVTIAADNDKPIDPSSALLANLTTTLLAQGDPHITLEIKPRTLIVLVLSAHVAVQAGFVWDDVEPAIRAALLDRFGFERRDLGQTVYLSEVIAAIQSVGGVQYATIDVFDGVSEASAVADLVRLANATGAPKRKIVARLAQRSGSAIQPSQLAVFEPTLKDAIVLQQIASP